MIYYYSDKFAFILIFHYFKKKTQSERSYTVKRIRVTLQIYSSFNDIFETFSMSILFDCKTTVSCEQDCTSHFEDTKLDL